MRRTATLSFRWRPSSLTGSGLSGADGKFGTDDDVKFDNDLHVPVSKVVRVQLSSKDVIHSFFLPNLRLKQDAVPGRTILTWFEATKPGKYELPCAELCGFGHSGMKGWLNVYTPEDYQKWAAEKLAPKRVRRTILQRV